MYKIGDNVEAHCRTNTADPNSPRVWKLGKVLAARRSLSGLPIYTIDFANGRKPTSFGTHHLRPVKSENAPTSKPTVKVYRPKAISDYPHVCPNCRGPAYIGMVGVDCQRKCAKDPFIRAQKR